MTLQRYLRYRGGRGLPPSRRVAAAVQRVAPYARVTRSPGVCPLTFPLPPLQSATRRQPLAPDPEPLKPSKRSPESLP